MGRFEIAAPQRKEGETGFDCKREFCDKGVETKGKKGWTSREGATMRGYIYLSKSYDLPTRLKLYRIRPFSKLISLIISHILQIII
jgi:hypothetical protein